MNGLGALTNFVPAGAWISWQGKVYIGGTNAAAALDTDLQNQISGALYAQDWFSSVNVYHSLASWINIKIDAQASQGFAQLADVQSVIEGAIYNYTSDGYGQPYYARTESLSIASYPAGYTAAQAGVPVPQAGQSSPLPGSSWVCSPGYEWSWSSLGCVHVRPVGQQRGVIDSLAETLGVTPTTAAIVGAFGALFIVIAIGKIAK